MSIKFLCVTLPHMSIALALVAVHLFIRAVLDRDHILARQLRRAERYRRQEVEFLAALAQPAHKVPRTGLLPVAVPQQDAEFVAARTVAITMARISALDAARDLGKADIPLQVAVLVVDLLEVVHIENDEHLAAPAHLRRAIEIAVLIQKTCERVELVPHLAAIDKIEHREERHAQPRDVQLRQLDLDDALHHKKDDKRVDEHAAAILKLCRRDDRRNRKIDDRRKVHHDIDLKKLAARIDVFFTHGKDHAVRQRGRQHRKIHRLTHGRRAEPAPGARLLIQHIHKAERHRRRQAEAEVIRRDIQPAILHRRTVDKDRNDLQHRDHGNERVRKKEAALLLSVERLTQLCQHAHEAQNKQIDHR